jgi:hypothetical protein
MNKFIGYEYISLNTVLIVLLIVLIIGVLLTLISNLLTCVIFFDKKNRESRPKMLLGNIALSDIIYILAFILPLMVIMPLIIENNSFISHIIQSTTNYINAISLYVTSLTITAIALDRYYLIIFTTIENPFDKISSKMLIIFIWILSFLLSIPFFVTYDIYYLNIQNVTIECFTDEKYLKNISIISDKQFLNITRKSRFLFQYLIPVLMISYFYTRIIYHLFGKRNSNIRISNSRFQQKCWKTTKMLIAVVIVFTVCNFAFYFNEMKNLLNFETEKKSTCVDINTTLSLICYIIFITSCLFNPFIYWWMSSKFRKDFKRIFWRFQK